MDTHRVLVTGLRGFVGSTLAGRARASEMSIEVSGLLDGDGKAIDIRDQPRVADAVAALQPTAVIHLAAIASPRDAQAEPGAAWAVNVMGTFNLAQAVLQHAPKARFVFAGSSEAYGASFLHQEEPLREDAPFQPQSVYGATKASADLMLAQMVREGLRATRFRPFNHTGRGQTAAYVASAFARQIVRIERGWQEPVMVVGNLDARRDFLDVRDVADAYLLAAMCSDENCVGDFNLATGAPVAISELLDALVALSPVSIDVRQDPTLMRPSEIPVISGNPDKAKRQLAWQPRVSLNEMLREVLGGWRELADQDGRQLKG
ncbi:GDP-mannose 4,6-dehydratase [Tianweitania sediminis]|uniref:GDP-mannose 4,6-dehydratase n=1 Tax=Tianweitania sediminis TaxID=1502156 RepID=A0A8J7R3P4_9HYPH|nr:GDP-mannose 4,6-dehydratase [Tianweitania sediminis]MBP0441197.1 GDP-mannose 4,6-dehydratase [Tianweitania sediminis]